MSSWSEFRLTGERQLDPQLQTALQWLWNGLRVLPHSDGDIAEGVCACVELHQRGFYRSSHDDNQRITTGGFGPSMMVEFGAEDGSDSRGWVNVEALQSAVRVDVEQCLAQNYRHRAGELRFLLQIIFSPPYLIDFHKLARLFARQLVPTQALSRKGAAFFPPARLRRFGLP